MSQYLSLMESGRYAEAQDVARSILATIDDRLWTTDIEPMERDFLLGFRSYWQARWEAARDCRPPSPLPPVWHRASQALLIGLIGSALLIAIALLMGTLG